LAAQQAHTLPSPPFHVTFIAFAPCLTIQPNPHYTRRHKKDAADAARPIKAASSSAPAISGAACSELQERLRQRQTRLESTEEEPSKDQD
jgi:hypothetical protein